MRVIGVAIDATPGMLVISRRTDQYQINAQGRLILEQTVEAGAAVNDISIPVADLATGIYELILLRNGVPVGRVRVVKN